MKVSLTVLMVSVDAKQNQKNDTILFAHSLALAFTHSFTHPFRQSVFHSRTATYSVISFNDPEYIISP